MLYAGIDREDSSERWFGHWDALDAGANALEIRFPGANRDSSTCHHPDYVGCETWDEFAFFHAWSRPVHSNPTLLILLGTFEPF